MSVPQKLKGRYEIREILGQGGMGVVYRAYDDVVKRDVALKTLRDAPSRVALEMFFKECNVLAGLSHPNIIEVFDLGEYEEEGKSKPFFVMPLLPGATLDRLIKAASHRLTVERVVDIVCQACRALHAAHERGLVHRDIKPSNIFVMDDDSVKIIDFGVAHLVEQGQSVGLKGTLLYMAPEQLQMKPASAASDIFALGVVAYESFTRRRPFEGANEQDIAEAILRLIPPAVADLNPAVSQAISRAVHKAMAKQPWNRYANPREFAETLTKALRNEPIEFFNPARIQPRIERASKAFESGDLNFAAEILTELEAEGHIDPAMQTLRRQIELASRTRTITQLLESARTRFEHDEFPLALHKVQEILQLDPGNAHALGLKASVEKKLTSQKVDEWYRLARQHLDNRVFSHAREAVQNIFQLQPADARATQMLGEIDRAEQEYLAARRQKQELYQAALEAWNAGEVSVALTKLERVLDIEKQSPDTSAPEQTESYQQLYNKVRSEHESLKNSYSEARKLLADRSFAQAAAIANEWLAKYPGHALFQALKFDIDEQQRQELSARVAAMERELDAEPDLERKVSLLEKALAEFPGEAHFERQLRPVREKRDLVNAIAAKARWHEERGQFAEAFAQWEILKTIYSQYPGLCFEIERVAKRRDQQTMTDAKSRWLEQIDRAIGAGDYDRATGLAASAEAEFPGDPEIGVLAQQAREAADKAAEGEKLLAQGKALCAQQWYDEGLGTMRKALALTPRNLAVRAALLEALIERGRVLLETDWRAAEPYIQQALEVDPNHAIAKSLRTAVADHKRDEAVVHCFTQARQHRASGNLEAALQEAEACFAQYPLDPRLQQLRDILTGEIEKIRLAKERPTTLNELRLLQLSVESAKNESEAKPLIGRARELLAQYADDPDFQGVVAAMEQRLKELQPPAEALASAAATIEPSAAVEPPPPLTIPPPPPPAFDDSFMPPPPLPAAAPPAAPPPLPAAASNKPAPPPKPPGPPRKPLNRTLIVAAAGGVAVLLLVLGVVVVTRMMRKPAVAGALRLEVKTVPEGATIRVNGKVRGTSNFVLETPPGSYQIEAALEGFQPATATVKAAPGSAPVEFTLQPLPQTVRLFTDLPEGKVLLDDQPARDLQEGQIILDSIAPGAHTLKVTSRTGEAVFTLDVTPGRPPVVSAPPVVKALTVLLIANLGATARVYSSVTPPRVEVDGQPAGEAGPTGLELVNLAPGTHEIAVGEGKTQLRKTVEISAAPALTAFLQSDQNVGMLLILAGEDGADVFIDGQRWRRQTSRGGQVRIPREPREYRVRVAKQGFQDVPEQRVQLAKGEERKLVFKLVALPTTAHLNFSGATAGAQVFLDGNLLGTVQPDGSFRGGSVPPGDHTVELRSGTLRSRPVRRTFAVGQTVELGAAEIALHSTTGTMRLNVAPAGAQVTVVRSGGAAVPVSGASLELEEGSYTVTARAPGHTERTETVRITGGQTAQVNFALTREVQKPKAVILGMEGWARPWQQDGEWFVQKGGGMLLYRAVNTPGSYSFNIMHAAGGGLLRGKDLEWFAAYTDPRNYVLYRLEKDSFRRIEVVNGKRTEQPKKNHGLDLKDEMMATVEVEVTADAIINRVKKGSGWSVLDAYSARSMNLAAGRFGINVRGNDQIRLAGFSFHGKE